MSKIERALRKAEEERRKEGLREDTASQPSKGVFVLPNGVVETAEALPEHAHIPEYYRKIAGRLKFFSEHVGVNDVIFTSAVSGEGKTTNAINCALSLCQDFHLSVCLADFDLRNPKLSDYFPSNGSLGVVDILRGQAEVESVIQPTPLNGLSIVTSYGVGRQSLPLLNSARLGRLISELRARFDFVIFDSPPILPLADTVTLSKSVSAIVLIVEAGKTRRKQIGQVFEQIDREKVIGFIMNYKTHHVPETYNYSKYYDYGANE